MHEDTVIVATGGRTSLARAFSAENGKVRWQRTAGPGSFRGAADVFVANGLLWMGTLTTEGIDPITGNVVKELQAPELFTDGHHSRCYRARGTENYLLWSKRGVEFLDLSGESHSRNDWVRGTCRYGVMPANGLLYAPPTPCFCYPGAKLNGFNALASASTKQGERVRVPTAQRLQLGPAFASIPNPPAEITHSQDWPTYRHDNARSGATSSAVSAAVEEVWNVTVGGRLSPPIMAQGRVFVADKESHAVHCLDASSGKKLWHYIAGGSIDSPPTFHEGRVLFGCTDGWVYCLDAEHGELAWRFRAAPRDQRILSNGQIQSSWPVHGSVLIESNTAYVVAGRSSFLDGGLYLYGLDVPSGRVRHKNRLNGPWEDPHQKTPHGAHWMDGGSSDILVCESDRLYMLQNAFDLQLRQVDSPVIAPHGARRMGRHLIATGGFLDDTGFDRIYWMHAALWPGLYYGIDAPKTGQILVFDQDTTFALHTFSRRFSRSPYFAPGGDGYDLVADDNENEPYLDPQAAKREREPGYSRKHPPKWQVKVPIRARAMVLANNTLFLAGPPDTISDDDPLATFEGRGGALLWAVSSVDGSKLEEVELEAQPVFDGLIAAQGCLFLTTVDGHVRCFSKGNR
jgi:outer membrane protein assembly factor BamB